MPRLRHLGLLRGRFVSSPLPQEVLERAKLCNSTHYQITNYIQDGYVTLVINPDDFHIVYASDNTQKIFYSDAVRIIEKDFLSLLEQSSAEAIKKLLQQECLHSATENERLLAEITLAGQTESNDALFYRSGDYVCIDIETKDFSHRKADRTELLFLRLAGRMDEYVGNSSDLAGLVCALIEKIIGFDRIWYCEFDKNDDGYVSGEWNNGAFPSLLYQRFPSTDIPENFRAIYTRNKFRCIADSKGVKATLIDQHSKAAPPLDLTYSIARRPGDTHIEYLVNMGVTASASFSVVQDGKLKALFGAHSKTAKWLGYRQLALCQYLVNKFLTQYTLLNVKEQQTAGAGKEDEMVALANSIIDNGFDIAALIHQNPEPFTRLIGADAFMSRYNGVVYGGDGLEDGEKHQLLAHVAEHLKGKGLYHADSLQYADANFKAFKNKASGVLALSLDEKGDDLFIWLRKEHAYHEQWAGNPSRAVVQDKGGRVGPRSSFEAWARKVEGKCVSWSTSDIAIAQKFREMFVLYRANHHGKIGLENAKRLDAVLATVVDGIISINSAGIIQAFNAAAERIFGFKSPEVIGKNVKLLMPEPDSTQHDHYLSDYMNGGEAKVIGNGREVTGKRKDGSTFSMDLAVNEMQLAGARIFVATVRDISARKRMESEKESLIEKLSQSNSELERFAYVCSHDLQEPLRMIGSFTQLLEQPVSQLSERSMM